MFVFPEIAEDECNFIHVRLTLWLFKLTSVLLEQMCASLFGPDDGVGMDSGHNSIAVEEGSFFIEHQGGDDEETLAGSLADLLLLPKFSAKDRITRTEGRNPRPSESGATMQSNAVDNDSGASPRTLKSILHSSQQQSELQLFDTPQSPRTSTKSHGETQCSSVTPGTLKSSLKSSCSRVHSDNNSPTTGRKLVSLSLKTDCTISGQSLV